MKKCFALLLFGLVVLLAVGCENVDENLDIPFDAVYCVDAGEMISLGDSREQVEGILGSPMEDAPPPTTTILPSYYANSKVQVNYTANDFVEAIVIWGDYDKFRFRDIPLRFGQEWVAKNYDVDPDLMGTENWYHKYFDSDGKMSSLEEAFCSVLVRFEGDSKMPGCILLSLKDW